MRQKCYVLILFFISCFTFSQSNIDTLKLRLEKTTDPEQKLLVLDTITKQMIRTNHDGQSKYLREYIDLARDLENYDLMASKSRFLIQQHIFKGDIEKAFAYIDSMLLHKDRFEKESSLGHLLLKRGGVHFMNVDYKRAIEDYKASAALFLVSKDSIFAADAYFFSAQANGNLGDFVGSVEGFERAYELYEQLGDIRYTVYVGNELSILFGRNGLEEEALKKRNQLIAFCKANKEYDPLALLYSNVALNYFEQGHLNEAKTYLGLAKEALPLRSGEPTIERTDYYIKGLELSIDLEEGDLAKARQTYEDFMAMEQDYDRSQYFLEMIVVKAKYLRAINRPIQALNLLRERESALDSDKNAIAYIQMQKLLSELYVELGDLKNANYYLDAYTSTKDSIYKSVSANAYAYQQSRFESEQKKKELLEQKVEIQTLESEKELQSARNLTLWIVLLSIGLSAIGIIYFFWKQNHDKKEKLTQSKIELERFRTLLLKKSNEKEILAKEIDKLKETTKDGSELMPLEKLMNTKILTQEDWINYKQAFNEVYPHFFSLLKLKAVRLTDGEERLLALEKLSLKTNEIANILGIAVSSVRMTRYRLRKKLGLETDENLMAFFESPYEKNQV